MKCLVVGLGIQGQKRKKIAGRDVVLSRQLETLVLGRAARDGFAPDALLVQECLDVHRLLVCQGLAARLLRWLEHRLLAACDLVITSSPAGVTDAFTSVSSDRSLIAAARSWILLTAGVNTPLS
jgi:hypothetical protein